MYPACQAARNARTEIRQLKPIILGTMNSGAIDTVTDIPLEDAEILRFAGFIANVAEEACLCAALSFSGDTGSLEDDGKVRDDSVTC